MTKLNVFMSSFLVCFFTAVISFAGDNPQSSFLSRVHDGHLCPRNSAWLTSRNMIIKISSKQPQQSASYDIKIFENNDMQIVLNGAGFNNDNLPSEAILVSGRALITKNVQIEENYAIDVLDGAVLFQQLAITLIELASNEGPNKTKYPLNKNISEKEYPIKTTTQSAHALFNAPWSAKVNLTKEKEGFIFYKIDFTYQNEGKITDIHMEGSLSNYGPKNTNKYISDDFKISEWKQYDVGPYSKKIDTGTIYDFGTTFIEKPYNLLGELRKYIKDKYKK